MGSLDNLLSPGTNADFQVDVSGGDYGNRETIKSVGGVAPNPSVTWGSSAPTITQGAYLPDAYIFRPLTWAIPPRYLRIYDGINRP